MVAVELALELLSMRASALASNIANVNTPNYRRVDVPFFSVMRSLLKDTGKSVKDKQLVVVDTSPPTRPDGNNTAIERELAALSETALLYQATLQIASQQLRRMRIAAGEGRHI